MRKKVRFKEKTTVFFIKDTQDEDFWRRTKQKIIAYIKYKSKVEFDTLMKDSDYRLNHYNRIDKINRHRLKTLTRLKYIRKINSKPSNN